MNPNVLPEATLEDMLEESTDIINQNIGSFDLNISDVRFLSRIKKLNNRMTSRNWQIKKGQGLPGSIPLFSPNDFLIERERMWLKASVGVILQFRNIGGT